MIFLFSYTRNMHTLFGGRIQSSIVYCDRLHTFSYILKEASNMIVNIMKRRNKSSIRDLYWLYPFSSGDSHFCNAIAPECIGYRKLDIPRTKILWTNWDCLKKIFWLFQVSYLIVDEADREMEIVSDPFLDAGIDIPKELPYINATPKPTKKPRKRYVFL